MKERKGCLPIADYPTPIHRSEISPLVSWSATRRSVVKSVSQSVSRYVSRLVSLSVNQSVGQSISFSITWSLE